MLNSGRSSATNPTPAPTSVILEKVASASPAAHLPRIPPVRHWTRRLRWFWLVLRRAAVTFFVNGNLGRAKAAAYSAFTALFPLLTTTATILVYADANRVQRTLAGLLAEVLPPGTETFVAVAPIGRGDPPIGLLASMVLVSLWAGSGVMMTLLEGFQLAYRTPGARGFLHQRLIAVFLVLASGLPVMIASSLLVVGPQVEEAALRAIGLVNTYGVELQDGVVAVGHVVRFLLTFSAIVLGASALYHFGPEHPDRSWRRVLPGALLASALWGVATAGFAWYVRNLANYSLLYGSIGTVIVLLVWMYLLSLVALYGCEYNAERTRRRAIKTAK